jgi:hypothetical protein
MDRGRSLFMIYNNMQATRQPTADCILGIIMLREIGKLKANVGIQAQIEILHPHHFPAKDKKSHHPRCPLIMKTGFRY